MVYVYVTLNGIKLSLTSSFNLHIIINATASGGNCVLVFCASVQSFYSPSVKERVPACTVLSVSV